MKSRKYSVSTLLPRVQAPSHLARNLIETTLRDAILDGRLVSGTPLRQEELAELFGVSRMPVREALRQLEAQALVQIVPHKGAVVTQLISDDAVETYAVRLLLEPEALRQSIPNLQAQDLEEAHAHIAAMENETDLASLGRLNRLFHLALYRRTPNAKLLRLIDNELQEEERFLRFHLSAMGLGEMAQDDHKTLVALAAAGNTEGAAEVLRKHLQMASDTIRSYLERRLTS
ncbi:TPA: GntR family transcriptional regulator [Pseudomonas aeruginosa]|uniref:GntR family transcriptional regulator n=1 Tax=Pseudomonas aeruginosa group TaxID=136841 RepID=UPI0006B2A8BD|nr:GntR family transcriptional regulator [Pseudomonas aeruginosa]VTS28174.1 transcriptional regulator [Streptococcus dysgalactiae subsp. equisimilis]KRU93801.1 GntR family transcriptional regulator [Pseudomonas aeruginosa]KSR48826.1 GntR family transcriptional regulator [Pseudomonas aeruginosa]RPV10947.1 GntR family transcriptional regulator [Pseudomonas aeruginosa]HBN8602315.1 GntR family transcriptional regulator [Pseudomonas aeruginosa]